MAKDYYRDLELDSYASSADIKKAYYELSKKYHPDLNSDQDPESLKRFHAITEAYDVLGDPRKRRKYDKGSFVGSASERDDHELVKYKYKGEEFMQKRSETKDRYSGEGAYCSIRSNKTTERGRKMDDSVMRLRRKAFERNQQFDRNADFYEHRHNLKARNEAVKGPRHHSYTRSSVQSGNSGGGGMGSVAIIFVIVFWLSCKFLFFTN